MPSNKLLTAWASMEALAAAWFVSVEVIVAPWLGSPLFCSAINPELLKVDPMSPHLMLEKVTLNSGVVAMMPAGSPAVALQGPAPSLSSPGMG